MKVYVWTVMLLCHRFFLSQPEEPVIHKPVVPSLRPAPTPKYEPLAPTGPQLPPGRLPPLQEQPTLPDILYKEKLMDQISRRRAQKKLRKKQSQKVS